jgi:hypothetical protein
MNSASIWNRLHSTSPPAHHLETVHFPISAENSMRKRRNDANLPICTLRPRWKISATSDVEAPLKTRKIAGFEWLFIFWAGLLTWAAPALIYGQTPTQEFIVDLLTAPNKYWNKSVMLKGHVRSVTANPPGTNRGSYVMRDSTDADITVLSDDLPALGKEYTVSGNVEQLNPDQKVPVLREVRRVLGSEAPKAMSLRRPSVPDSEVAPAPKRAPAVTPAPPPPVAPPPAPREAPAQPKELQPVIVQTATPPETSMISWPLIIAIAVLAVILIGVLVVMMRPKPVPVVAASAAYAPPLPSSIPGSQPALVRPVAPPPSTVRPAAGDAGRGAATQLVPPPAAKATEVFFDLRAELVINDGPDRGKRFNLTKTTITIGRSGARQNDVTLSDSTVSREHAKIIYSVNEKTFRLINESATNPARLNGNPVDTAILNDSDTIQTGATVFQFKRT